MSKSYTEKTIQGKTTETARPYAIQIDFFLLSVALFGTLADPSLNYGTAIGPNGMFTLVAMLLPSFLLALLIWTSVLASIRWTNGRHVLHGVAVVLSTFAFYHLLFFYFDKKWRVADDLIQAKIEYFCLKKFSREQCVRQVNICPECALKIDRYNREKIVLRLKAFRSEYPPEVLAKVRAQEAQQEGLNSAPADTREPAKINN